MEKAPQELKKVKTEEEKILDRVKNSPLEKFLNAQKKNEYSIILTELDKLYNGVA